MTAKPADVGGRGRTIADYPSLRPNYSERWWTALDGSPAVFKTVCGASMDVRPRSCLFANVHCIDPDDSQ
jgi:hypothetical protein